MPAILLAHQRQSAIPDVPAGSIASSAPAAEGLFFTISNDPDPIQMQQIAAGISQSILVTAAGGATRPMTVAALAS